MSILLDISNLSKISFNILNIVFWYKVWEKLLISLVFTFLPGRCRSYHFISCHYGWISWLTLLILSLFRLWILETWQQCIDIEWFLLNKISDLKFVINVVIASILLLFVLFFTAHLQWVFLTIIAKNVSIYISNSFKSIFS